MERVIMLLYRFKFYRLAYLLAEKYLPPIHPLNFNDEEGA